MADKNMSFLQSILWMKIIHPNPIIKASDYQFFSNNFPSVDCNFISSNFIFIPKQNELILIASDQNAIQDKSHPDSFFMICPMLHNNFQRLSLDEQAARMISHK